MNWKINQDDKLIRRYYGANGWMYVFRTNDGQEYHISAKDIVDDNYKKNIYMK